MPDWDFKYMWPFDVVEFSAIDIHTRRPYKRQPKMEAIQFYNHSSADGSCSLTLLFDSSRALEKVKTLLTDDSFLRDTAEKYSPVVNPTPLLAIYQVLFTIHHLINEETRQFIENVFSQASDIVRLRLCISWAINLRSLRLSIVVTIRAGPNIFTCFSCKITPHPPATIQNPQEIVSIGWYQTQLRPHSYLGRTVS